MNELGFGSFCSLALASTACCVQQRAGPPGTGSRGDRARQSRRFRRSLRNELRRMPRRRTAPGEPRSGLADPVYLAIADDATIRRVTTNGVPGTAMPAFAQSAGGLLTESKSMRCVHGIRARWAKPNVLAMRKLRPIAAQAPGDPGRGANVYATFCSSCHGPAGGAGNARAPLSTVRTWPW